MTDMKQQNVLPAGIILDSGRYRYTVGRTLGKGGFGITYYGELKVRVNNIDIEAPIAIKEFFPSSLCERAGDAMTMSYSNPIKEQVECARRDFMGEARRLHSLANKHPNIVTVNEVFEANNTAYYIMEYLEGESLDTYIKDHGPMDEATMLTVMRPIIDAVAFIHDNLVTHLDIKPANIMLEGSADIVNRRPVLIDFGLSKHYDAEGNATSTINSSGFSDGYAPKEQYRGITTFSPAADVYSLGATMLYCLKGQRLPSALDLDAEMIASYIPSTISLSLRRFLIKALAYNARDRYADGRNMLTALPKPKAARKSSAKSTKSATPKSSASRTKASKPVVAKSSVSKEATPRIIVIQPAPKTTKKGNRLFAVLYAIALVVLAISVIGLICPMNSSTHPANPLMPIKINNMEDYHTFWGCCALISGLIAFIGYKNKAS